MYVVNKFFFLLSEKSTSRGPQTTDNESASSVSVFEGQFRHSYSEYRTDTSKEGKQISSK